MGYSVDRMEVQPVRIPYRKADGRPRIYVPDVAVYPFWVFATGRASISQRSTRSSRVRC